MIYYLQIIADTEWCINGALLKKINHDGGE